jgi:hypothetical protein
VTQCGDLEIDGAFGLAAGGNLQDVARAIRGRQPMVLVALTVEWRERAFEAPELAGTIPKLPERNGGRIEVQVYGTEGPLRGDIHSCGLRRGGRIIVAGLRQREVMRT